MTYPIQLSKIINDNYTLSGYDIFLHMQIFHSDSELIYHCHDRLTKKHNFTLLLFWNAKYQA